MIKFHTPTQISAVYRKHVLLNAKMTIYNDWLMPEQYLLHDNEIQHSKNNLGLCDISQISKIEISGPNINQILTTISSTAVCNIGEIIDLNIKNNNQLIKIFWCQLSIDKALIISWHNTNELISLLNNYLKPQINLINMTFGYTALSLIGPLTTQLLSKLTDINLHYPVYSMNRSLRSMILRRKGSNIKFIHALKNINLNAKKGDRIGLIGNNGSGKTTLLKIIGGIYSPSSGSVFIKHDPYSLFDVSMGLNADATGIENIYILGYLRGFTKTQILERIDKIIEFSELNDFINLPINTYSSGMKIRLATSFALEIESKILLIDE